MPASAPLREPVSAPAPPGPPRCWRWPAVPALVGALVGCADPCLVPGTICTIAGVGTDGFSGDDGPATRAELYLPMDVAIGPDGLVYVVDYNNHRVRRIDADGRIRTLLGTGSPGDVVTDDPESLNHPTTVLFDGAGGLLVSATHNAMVKRFDLATGAVTPVCGSGRRGYSGDGGAALAAEFDLPGGLALLGGELFVLDQANQVLRRLTTDGRIERVAGRCELGPAIPGRSPAPCPGSQKVTWVPESEEDRCTRACAPRFEGDGGPALEARFALPGGQTADPAGRLAVNSEGHLFLADTENHRIRRIDLSGRIETVAGSGEPGVSDEPVRATELRLRRPADIAVGPDDLLYIADTGHSCVRRLNADGWVETVAGRCGEPARSAGELGDFGPAREARLYQPYGIALGPDGALYIADTRSGRVRRVSPR